MAVEATVPAASREVVLAARVQLARVSFVDFVRATKKGYRAEKVHEYLAGKLEHFMRAVERAESPRLMVFLPPQSGKSTLVSRYFPPWVLGWHPEWRVGIVSYGAELAEDMSQDARRVIQSEAYRAIWPEHRLDPTSKAVSDWTLEGHEGGVRALGMGGAITGRSLEILVLDDPVKGRLEADRDSYRAEQQAWWPQAHDRVQEGGGIVVLCTRWHWDDLPGHLLKVAGENPLADQWEVVSLPALAEKGDVLGRKEGEPLAPSRHSLAWLLRERANIPARDWLAKFQQRPTPDEGAVFRSEWLRYEEPPVGVGGTVFQTVDTAFSTRTSADYTVVQTWRVEASGTYRLLHQLRERLEFPSLKRRMMDLFEAWAPRAVVIEDMGSGKSLIQELRAETRLPVLPWKPDRDKVARAHASTPAFAGGRVVFPTGAPWVGALVDELLRFPSGAHDDQVDALTLAINLLARPGERSGAGTVLRAVPYRVDAEMPRPLPDGYRKPILA